MTDYNVKDSMTFRPGGHRFAPLLLLALLLAAPAAHAFRCGNRIVVENMHELQVRNVCGEPASERHLGFVIRSVEVRGRRGLSAYLYSGYGFVTQEVSVTEYVYNFGPRKFMRRLVFEGGILVSIETIGYGFREHGK